MNAPIRPPKCLYRSDRDFLLQLKIANRQQLRAMLQVFELAAPKGCRDNNPYAFKRAAVERRLGVNRTTYPWLRVNDWWKRP